MTLKYIGPTILMQTCDLSSIWKFGHREVKTNNKYYSKSMVTVNLIACKSILRCILLIGNFNMKHK